MVKVYAISGVSSVGRIMLGYEINDKIIICDLGINESLLPGVKDYKSKSYTKLIEENILPNCSELLEMREKVVGIVLSNADSNHIGGVEFLAKEFGCPIYASSYTTEILKATQEVKDLKINEVKQNVPFNVDGINIELVNTTYSVPQTSMIAIHDSKGIILHAPAFKFDNRPALGKKTNYMKLQEYEKKGVQLLVVDSIRSNANTKTMSEILVKEMIRDLFIEGDILGTQGIIVATKLSNVSRIKSIIDLSLEDSRKVLILGDFNKYISAAEKVGLLSLNKKDVEFANEEEEIQKLLKKANENKKKYVIISGGDQGEPEEVLPRIAQGKMPYKLTERDKIVLSSSVLHNSISIENREVLDSTLKEINCKVFKDLHVSGHASSSDIRDLIQMVKPKNVIPVQGDIMQKGGAIELCEELGYEEDKTLFYGYDMNIYKL